MSAKNITVITLQGKEVHRTLKKARQLAAKGNHRWRDDFTLIEIRPDSTDPDYARLLRVDLALVPRILPPRDPEGLLLTYPLPDQRSGHLAFGEISSLL